MYDEQGYVIEAAVTPEHALSALSNIQMAEVTDTHAFMFNFDSHPVFPIAAIVVQVLTPG